MEEATKIIIEQAWTRGDTVNMISSITMAVFTIVRGLPLPLPLHLHLHLHLH